jgi:cation transport regulator
MPGAKLSETTRKQIDEPPKHAQDIYKEAYENALKEYRDPSKRRGGAAESVEELASKVAWSAVKNDYEKRGGKWVKKE